MKCKTRFLSQIELKILELIKISLTYFNKTMNKFLMNHQFIFKKNQPKFSLMINPFIFKKTLKKIINLMKIKMPISTIDYNKLKQMK